MKRGYRYRIYPDREQRSLFAKTFGCCRFLYNRMLSDKIGWYEKHKEMLQTTPAQYKKEYEWLKEVDSLALANVQLHLEKAYRNFFQKSKTGYPKYKSKRHPRQVKATSPAVVHHEHGKRKYPNRGKQAAPAEGRDGEDRAAPTDPC